MPNPIVTTELMRNILEVYRIFSQEMQLIRLKKTDLIKSIITRIDVERLDETRNIIKSKKYERQ